MTRISKYIFSKVTKKEIFENIEDPQELKLSKMFFENALVDAEFALNCITPFINKKIKILEIGGGLHLLSSYLESQNYNIVSIEPGEFTHYSEQIRINIINKLQPKNYKTCSLDEYSTEEKFDFIFSINVLEHTKNIDQHINSQISLLNKNGVLLNRCPNYNFPFEPHYYKFFIPGLPKLTFSKVLKKRLILQIGEKKYEDIKLNVNFDCKYSIVNRINKFNFINPFIEIFQRIENDKIFKERILQNFFVKVLHKIIVKFKLEKLFKFYPKKFYPYLIFSYVKKN